MNRYLQLLSECYPIGLEHPVPPRKKTANLGVDQQCSLLSISKPFVREETFQSVYVFLPPSFSLQSPNKAPNTPSTWKITLISTI